MWAEAEPAPYVFPAPASGPIVDIATAPIIVVGVAGDSESVFFKDEGIVRTFTKFLVDSVERGEISPDSEITISALGGKTPELTQLSEHQPIFVGGQKSRLFLTANEKFDGSIYRVFGLDQGKQDVPTVTAANVFRTADTCSQPYCLTGLDWSFERLPVGYRVNPNTADETGEQNAVQGGFNTWERSDSRMDFHYLGTTTIASVGLDGISVVFWNTVQGEYCAVTNWVACWHPLLDANGQYSEFDIDFNDAYKWEIGPEANEFDIESVALHEAGHALGLDHTTISSQVMFEAIGAGEVQRTLGSGDIAGVTFLYPGNVWYLRNTNSAGPPDVTPFGFGVAADTPVAGDWDGDGDDTPGVFRSPNSWFLNDDFGGPADYNFSFGTSGDKPVAGDWDGDGDVTPGIVRGNTWHLNNGFDGTAEITFSFGSSTDVFLVGNWDGADGCAAPNNCADTPGVFRSPTPGSLLTTLTARRRRASASEARVIRRSQATGTLSTTAASCRTASAIRRESSGLRIRGSSTTASTERQRSTSSTGGVGTSSRATGTTTG